MIRTGFRAKMLLLTQDILEKLCTFNRKPENWDLKDYTPGTQNQAVDEWGGGRARRLLQLAYTIAFTCLLRVDEVLRIQCDDFVLLDDNRLQLTLQFRKTSQFGGASNHAMTLLVLITSP